MKKNQLKILLIDDNPDDTLLLKEIIDDCAPKKFDIHACTRLSEAFQLLSSDTFDLILLDLILPDSPELTTFADPRFKEFDIPVVVISSLDDEDLALRAVQNGAQDYLVKGELSGRALPRAMDYAIERHSLKKQLFDLSIKDNLTGLYNRKGFSTFVDQQLKLALRSQAEMLFFFIDVDNLKMINDQFGHKAGDRALEVMAEILSYTFRGSDIVSRVGGDEFAILTVDSKAAGKDSIIERLEKEHQKYEAAKIEPFELQFSVGVARWTPTETKPLEVLMREADLDMYEKKRHKRENTQPQYSDGSLHGFEDVELNDNHLADTNKFLLVEDNLGDARLVQEYLHSIDSNYQVTHVGRLSDAINYVENNPTSLILLDLSLPDSHGLETVEKMVSVASEIPLVVMTGSEDHDMALQALKLGAQDYLPKGNIDEQMLGRSIQYASERHQLYLQNKRYAHKLQQSEARLSSIFNNVAIGMYRTTPDGEILFANRALVQMMGFASYEELALRNLEDQGYSDQSYRKKFKQTIEEHGYIIGLETSWEKADGTLIVVRESAKAIRSSNGEILYYEGTAEDITSQVEAEKQLRLQSAALDAAANAIMITGREGNVIWVNPAFEDLTGYSADEVQGKNPKIWRSGLHDYEFYRSFWETILSGMVWQGEMVNRRKGGSLYTENQTVAPVLDAKGDITHFIAIKEDVTPRKQSEETLRQRLKELTVLKDVALAGVTETDEDYLIAKVTHTIGENLYPNHFGVMLLNETRQVLEVHHSYRGLPDGFEVPEFTLEQGVIGSVAKTGLARRIADVTQVKEFITSNSGMRSELCVPLVAGEKVIGVINAESTKLNAFSLDDERLLTTVAGQLAIAIEQIRHQKAETEQRIRAEALSDTAIAINSSLEFEQILDQIVDSIVQIVPHEACSIMFNENGYCRVVRHRGFDDDYGTAWIIDRKFEISSTENLKTMFETQQYLNIRDVHAYDGWITPQGGAWIRAHLGMPIIKDNHFFGVLTLDHSQPGFFEDEHIKSLKTLANQLATSMENARLFDEAEKRAAELSRLYNASGQLLAFTSADISSLSKAIVDTILTDFGQSNCSLLLIDEHSGLLKRTIASGPYSDQVIQGQELYVDGPGIAAECVRHKKLINVGDVSRRPEYVTNWTDARSEMAIPLIVGDDVSGVIDIQSTELNAFSENDERIVSVFAEQAALALENANLYQRQKNQLDFLEALHQIDLAITGSMDMHVTLDVVTKQVISQLKVDASAILLLNPFTLVLEPIANAGYQSSFSNQQNIRMGEGLGGKVAMQGNLLHRNNISGEDCQESLRKEIFLREGFESYYGIPLTAKGKILGVLELYKRQPFNPDPSWEHLANTIATQAAIAIDNASMFEDLEKSNLELSLAYDTTLEGWARALELRDRETEGHARRVVELTLLLARAMGVNGMDLVHIRRGALLHDVGKMGVPDRILQKPGPLDDDEWKIMREHPVYSFEWLSPISYLRPALDIPHYHHERWDGSGYPDGLSEEQIPLPARIFAIIDVWDALRSDRPYRKAWSREKTINHLKSQSGKHFDPQVAEAFIELIEELDKNR